MLTGSLNGLTAKEAYEKAIELAVKAEQGLTAMTLVRVLSSPDELAAARRLQLEDRRARLNEPALALRLFYGGPKAHLERLLSEGFASSAPVEGAEFGAGWYFSKYASRAHLYNAGGSAVLLALVAIGNTETVVRRDSRRRAPSTGYDSIIVPGRAHPFRDEAIPGRFSEEYVVFDQSQILPLHLIEYEATRC